LSFSLKEGCLSFSLKESCLSYSLKESCLSYSLEEGCKSKTANGAWKEEGPGVPGAFSLGVSLMGGQFEIFRLLRFRLRLRMAAMGQAIAIKRMTRKIDA
jgi:hypothetical protein